MIDNQGTAALLKVGKVPAGRVAMKDGAAVITIHVWPGATLGRGIELTDVIEDETQLATRLQAAATHSTGAETTLNVAGDSKPQCPACAGAVEIDSKTVPEVWRCRRWPICPSIGKVTRSHGVAKRFELRNTEGALIRINDSPAMYIHALGDEHHALRSDPELSSDGTGVCPECGKLVAVPFTSRQDER